MSTKTDKLVQLCLAYHKDPILGIKALFGVEPTNQQKDLILAAWERDARVAVSSCTGAGKTATLVWLTLLFLLTQSDCRILVTSPSAQQLNRVFHAEVLKWYHKMPQDFKDLLDVRRDNIYYKDRESQFASLVTASADNKESLQGGHADNYIVLIDEASGVEEDVFDLLLGTLSTGNGRLILTSNPTRSSGRFYEIFATDKMLHWKRLYFSSYDCPHTNKEWIEEMKATYGEDSDTFRIRILGQFPRAANSQFFPSDVVDSASTRGISHYEYMNFPVIGGLDIARFGDDKTVFVARQGPKLIDITTFHKIDTMEVVGEAQNYIRKFNLTSLNIDSIGVGAGVYDRMKQLALRVTPVVVSNRSTEPQQYYNLRSQLYGYTKNWLQNGAAIPNNSELISQLKSMEYGYNNKMQVQLVSKKDIKKKGLPSPDIPDALALTFYTDIAGIRYQFARPREIVKSNTLWA